MNKLEVLKRSDVFRELNDEQLGLVGKICDCEVHEPGAIIHRANTTIDRLYVIEEGLVAIIVEPGPLSQRQLQAACDFETFGWEAAIPPHLATATARALEKTKVLAFKGQELADLCSTNCKVGCIFYRGIARVVAHRLQAAYMQLLGVTSQY
jgi:CRP/FNR family cyclic AMP-dependent transcriptional regulator